MRGFCGNPECLDKLSYLPIIEGKFRQYEQLGLRVRSFLNLGIHDKLDPMKLAEAVGIKVVGLDAVEGLSEAIKRTLTDLSQKWSGATLPELPDGTRIVLLNSEQSARRQAVTLMEEICHVLLGHKHSRIRLASETHTDNSRDYNKQIEEEAYSVGAAALVPYRSLACDLSRGLSFQEVANDLGVSVALIRYRIRVLKLTSLL